MAVIDFEKLRYNNIGVPMNSKISEDWLAVIIAFIIILLSAIEILNNNILSIAF